MIILILIFPLLNFFVSITFCHVLGNFFFSVFSVFIIFISFIISIYFFFLSCLSGQVIVFNIFPWITCGVFSSNFGFIFDSLSMSILVLILTISLMVHTYSASYMFHDPHLGRFIGYLSFFTFFMIILVLADNFVLIFFGWEGVGLCSYLLINFWYSRIQANKAGIKAIIINRIGDFGLSLGIFILFYVSGSVDYLSSFSIIPNSFDHVFNFLSFDFYSFDIICFFIFIGAIGKSAQVGLHTWLPDAMEGPTPVSALIHSATIVTAGVFLIIRCSFLFEFSSSVLWLVSFVGGVTAFLSSLVGVFQNDIKKVIAYSTCSQLGYIVFSCGLSCYHVSFFHLFNHGFFKALLFLTAGGVIHSFSDEQDIRKYGGLIYFLPFCYSIIFIGSLALCGFPFLSGFYSKEVILEISYSNFFTTSGHFSYFCGILAAFFTCFYSFRMLYFTFFSSPNGQKRIYEFVKEISFPIALSLFILSMLSIFIGYFFRESFIGFSSPFFNSSIFNHPVNSLFIDSEFLPYFIKIIPLINSFFGFFVGAFLYLFFNYNSYLFKTTPFGKLLYIFFNKKFFFDKFNTEFLVQPFIVLCYSSVYNHLDKGFFEFFGPFGFSSFIFNRAPNLSYFQMGFINHYSSSVIFILSSLVFINYCFIFFISFPVFVFFFFCFILFIS